MAWGAHHSHTRLSSHGRTMGHPHPQCLLLSPGLSCSRKTCCISLLASMPHPSPVVTELPLSFSPQILVSPLLHVSLESGKRQRRLDGPEEKWEWEDLEQLVTCRAAVQWGGGRKKEGSEIVREGWEHLGGEGRVERGFKQLGQS